MTRLNLLVLLFGFAAFAGVAQAEEKPPFDLADPHRIEAGKARYTSSCAGYCHGFGGVGGNAPDFKGRGDELDPVFAFETITNGRKGRRAVMPRWGDAYSPDQIWELVAYLEFLAHQKPEQPQ